MTKFRGGVAAGGIVMGVGLALVFPGQAPPEMRSHRELSATGRELGRLNRRLAGDAGGAPIVIRTGRQRALQTDPTAPDYDPIVLNNVYENAPTTLFAAEPRSSEFAGPREDFLRRRVAKDLVVHFPDARVDKVECHTSICQVTVRAASESWEKVYQYVQQPRLGTTVQMASDRVEGAPDEMSIRMTILFSRVHRDHDTYLSWYRKQRAEAIVALRRLEWLAPDDE